MGAVPEVDGVAGEVGAEQEEGEGGAASRTLRECAEGGDVRRSRTYGRRRLGCIMWGEGCLVLSNTSRMGRHIGRGWGEGGLVLVWVGGDGEGEGGAGAGVVFGPEAAAVGFDDGAADGKAHAKAVLL